MQISWAMGHESKTKGTLLSQTLKVEEKKMSLFFLFVAQEPRYGHFIFLSQEVKEVPSSRRENGYMLAPGPWIKNKDTLFAQTFKVGEKKVSLFYWFMAQETRCGHFIMWSSGSWVCTIVKGRKCQYLGPWAINKKTNDTLLSQTLKVEEKKVSLIFWFVAQEPRYGHLIFEVRKWRTYYCQGEKMQISWPVGLE